MSDKATWSELAAMSVVGNIAEARGDVTMRFIAALIQREYDESQKHRDVATEIAKELEMLGGTDGWSVEEVADAIRVVLGRPAHSLDAAPTGTGNEMNLDTTTPSRPQ